MSPPRSRSPPSRRGRAVNDSHRIEPITIAPDRSRRCTAASRCCRVSSGTRARSPTSPSSASSSASYQSGEMPEDVFRVFRLNNGIYGQRQGGTNQMVRVKVPYGSMTPEQLEMMGYIAERYSRGWGHITTRQNIQFHFVQLDRHPRRDGAPRLGRADQPRGVRRHRAQHPGLPPRRRLPARGARHHAVGRGGVPALRAQPARPAPAAQVQDQLLRLLDRLRPGDVQRRRRRRRHPHVARTARSSAASACTSPVGSAPPRTRRWRSRSSRRARTCCPRSRRSCVCSIRPATATTSCGPASSG